MAAFAIISVRPDESLGKEIVRIYPDNSRELSTSAWLVADINKTTQEVCGRLGIVAGSSSEAVVVKIESYFGLAAPSIWEWLKVKSAGA